MDVTLFQDRIKYQGDLTKLFELVVNDYKLGKLIAYKPVLQGYEDFNVILETDTGKYLTKVMAASRSDDEAKQYADTMRTVLDNGISHPKLYIGSKGDLYSTNLNNQNIRLVVMDFVDGSDFFNLNKKPNDEEISFLSQQAAKINRLDLNPEFVYDSWAIPNFLKEYDQVKEKISEQDLEFIRPLVEKFPKLNIDKLPHCFVHGDIISTNVIRAKNHKLYIIDFAVANIYPRIQELAILLCDLFFVRDEKKYLYNYNLAIKEYQKITKLEKEEIEILPIYLKLAHAMHIIPATREKLKGTKLPENDFWLKSGQDGIRIASKIWR